MDKATVEKLYAKAEEIIKITCRSLPNGNPALRMDDAGDIQTIAYELQSMAIRAYPELYDIAYSGYAKKD